MHNADATAVATAYLATWNADRPPAERQALLRRHWSPEATYADPLAEVAGHDDLDALVAGVHERFPGFVFPVGGRGGRAPPAGAVPVGPRPEGAEPVVVGSDVVVLDEDGRVADVRGFLDQVPA